MQYSKIQKSLSSLLLFSIFFGLTLRVPFSLFTTFAGSSEFYNLVSVIVDEDSYDEIKSELKRYGEDIQGVLENTKIVIIPTPVNTPSFNISSLNESLYYNGYKGIDESVTFESKLIGTVLVGNFNLPTVFNGDESSRTILPFTDFEDKVYLFDHETGRYIKNQNNQNGLKSEIWHGVISPNFSDKEKNIEGLEEYFNKNHDFYKGTGNFKFSEGILNGNKITGVNSDYDPFVFYYDQFREEKALNYTNYKGYEAYLANKEDIVYNRYTKKLANKISELVLDTATDTIGGMVDKLSDKIDNLGDDSPFGKIPEAFKDSASVGPDTSMSPDIQTRHITGNMTKKFLEIFAKGIIGEFRTDTHNAGRYNKIGGEINTDLIPYFVTVLDTVNDGIIKEVNNELENKIDNLVKNGLARNIAIPTTYSKDNSSITNSGGVMISNIGNNIEYTNYLYGTKSANINEVLGCSIYRGNTENGGKLVEANRGLNFSLALSDKERIDNVYCLSNIENGTSLRGIWGGSSPLNINREDAKDGIMNLSTYDIKGAMEPLFSIGGSKKSINTSKNPSALDCFNNNFLLSKYFYEKTEPSTGEGDDYYIKYNYLIGGKNWSCTTDNDGKISIPPEGTSWFNGVNKEIEGYYSYSSNFEDFYKTTPVQDNDGDTCASASDRSCRDIVTHYGEYSIKKEKGFCAVTSGEESDSYSCSVKAPETWSFKFIPSWLEHKSPTAYELKEEIKVAITSDLPVDKDRYIDFIGTKGNLVKIDYPALFRVNIGDQTKMTLASVSEGLDIMLKNKSDEINSLINNNNPNSLTGKELKLYNILKVKDKTYPSANFDLIKFLKDKPSRVITIGTETKTISYYDTLVFAIYWNSLSTVSAKYGAVFDNYLNDASSSDDSYFLPKNKKQYEIAYLGAEGDAKNMYIKMDPEGKSENPYGDILSENINLSSLLLGSNIGGDNKEDEEALFKCAPPDGVPIWEWIPAVMCRLGEMMPPSISLSDGACGPSFLDLLSEEEKEELNQCNGDFDKNGINDCIENKLGNDGTLELVSDSKKYFYNKTADLTAIFRDKKGKVVTFLNSTKVKFEIVKIEGVKDNSKDIVEDNKKIVYDIDDIYINNKDIISNYVTFKDLDVNISGGKAKYGVGLKGADANIYLKASISLNDSNDKQALFMESEDLVLKIRGERLFNSSYKLENNDNGLDINSGINSLKVSDKINIFIADQNNGNISSIDNLVNNTSLAKEKLILLVDNISNKGKSISVNYPLNIKIKDSKDKIITEIDLNKDQLKTPKGITGIKKSGSYKVEITDNFGFKTIKNIELLAELPHTVETQLGATIMEAGGNISTNFLTIYDKYLNVVTGNFYNYNIKIDGKGVVFLDDDSDNLSGTTFEGFKIFRLKSTNKKGNNKIKVIISDSDNEKIIEGNRDLKVLDKVIFDATSLSEKIEVGYNKYKYKISLKDGNGNLLTDFNSRVYLNGSPVYIKTSGTYTDLIGGTAEVEFETKTVAGEKVGLEFQIEGLNNIIKKEIVVLPGKPMKVDLALSQNKIEASLSASSLLNIELKDRYNNIVFNDNTTKTSLEILDQYKHIISPNKKIGNISKGKNTYTLSATLNPGVVYFKVSTIPSLGNNSFIVKDANKEIEIKGVGSNAKKIETFYFWNDEKIKGKKYNSIYTNLLGSNYGDIEEENYLAGSLLFNKDNRSLAVTSLLNNPFDYSNILDLGNAGNLNVVHSSSDLTQDISITTEFINDKISLNLFNNSLNTYIGKIFYNFDDNISLIACDSNLSSCISKNETSISLKSFSEEYDVLLEKDKLIFKNNNGKILFTVNNDGTIIRSGIVNFDFNENNTGDYLGINIKSGFKKIGELGISFKNGKTNISRNEDSFNTKVNSLKNSILVLLKTSSYGTYISGNIYNKKTIFYYNDPFKNNKVLNKFSKGNTYGMENFVNKPGIGWKEGNKSLLEFASGKSVGESVKDYMSFSVINLGDPVISLKKIKKKLTGTSIDRKFDSTIGKLISNDDDISGYRIFDYDNDNKTDILLIKKDNNLKLLENKDIEGGLINKGSLAKIVDLGALDLVKTGDFTGDNFDDIFFVNKKGKPYLLNNNNKDFNRYSLVNQFNLDGRIVRAEVFDMDNDNVTDIITLDDAGKINIFYGSGTSLEPSFTKLTVSNDNGIKLNSEIRNDNSLIYFNGLHQPSLNSSEHNAFEKYLFVKYPYSLEEKTLDYSKILSQEEELPTNVDSLYFMKSEYIKDAGLKVEKQFIDKNDGFISSEDIIDVKITLTNTGNTKLENIIFTEKVPEIFSLDEESINIIGIENFEVEEGNLGYHFLINGIDLNIGEQIIITYKAVVRPVQYSFIDVGLFEKGELGDDLYGDIILKKDKKNCSNPVKLFRSLENIGLRSYQLGTKAPTCDEDKIKLPDELEKNTFDINGNGVPDYIDNLTNTDNLLEKDSNGKVTVNSNTDLSTFASEELEKMNKDSDNDGVPDNEDFLEGGVLDSLFTGSAGFEEDDMEGKITIGLGEDLQKMDSQLDNIQDVLNGLGCNNSSCFASPLNWAPLAPGSDPVLMGSTIGDGLNVDEGLPIISAMTGIPLYGPWGCIPIPMIWPISPIGLDTTCTSNSLGAGGRLGVDSPTNFFRLFITPTLTGGVGTAICFGGPASIVGISMPEGLSPIIPGGNCIVIAKKMDSCNGDGSDGDPSSIGIPTYSGNGSFGIINGNCGIDGTDNEKINEDQNTLQKLLTLDNGEAVKDIFGYLPGKFSENPIPSLFTGGDDNDSGISVNLDLSGSAGGSFKDVIKVQQTRISSTPTWLMDWVTRQIEEIVNKLTDFPTVFVILPDFTGVFDGNWGENSGNKSKYDKPAIALDKKISSGDGGVSEAITGGVGQVNSGIKEAYEFIGSIPLVKIKQEKVNITLPWISGAEIDKTILLRENTIVQREKEIEKAKKDWAKGPDASFNPNVNIKFDLDIVLDGLRKNLEIIKEYKKIPEKINKLINVKEDYLEQILCNVESISNILGGRIGKNGDRFKAWVELYILIKAILKSWQLLIDVFIDYETECHDCKNERQDALDSEFKLIDFIMPKIPVIQFPKWPDIIIDLHNIRAGLNVSLPEFNIDTKPILLPKLPKLYLPAVPEFKLNVGVDLSLSEILEIPELPLLPEIEIPELPELPNLPTVNLPDLPPPPKLPKMLASIEVVLDIIKLISKAMCILKSLPLHPEWRAGDQIAFLTERSGYLGTDFFDTSLPEFSFPFLDAIEVTTYVNLEFDTDFIVELARQIAMPINNFTNDFTNIFEDTIPDMDFRNALDDIPTTIDIDVGNEGVGGGISMTDKKILQILLAKKVGSSINHLSDFISEGQNEVVSNIEFKKLINKSLSSKSITSDPKMSEILEVWNNVNNMTYSKEDRLIKELKDNNRAKFDTLNDIINTEIIENRELKKKMQNIGNTPIITKVGFIKEDKIDGYNKSLDIYNNKFKDSAKKLFNFDDSLNKELKESGEDLIEKIKTPLSRYSDSLKENDNKILASVDTVNSNKVAANSCQAQANSEYKREYKGLYIIEGDHSYRLFDYLNELKGDEVTEIIDIDQDEDEDILYFVSNKLYLKENLKNNNIKIYVTEDPIIKNFKDTNFFDIDNFYEAINNIHEIGNDNGNINIGFSAPTDTNLNKFRLSFYNRVDKYLNDKLFFYKPKGVQLRTKDISDVSLELGEGKIINISKGTELISGDFNIIINYILVNDIHKKNKTLNMYRNQIIKLSEDVIISSVINNDGYRPEFIKKDIVDSIVNSDEITKIKNEETDFYIKRNNLVYIKNIGKVNGVKVSTKETIDISTNINLGKVVNINKGTKIYAGNNSFSIIFVNEETGDTSEHTLSLESYKNIEFKHNIKIIGITGNAYISGFDTKIYEGADIRKVVNNPLLPGSKISYIGNNYETSKISYIDLEYYDGSELGLDFNNIKSWELYDLGYETKDYSIRLKRNNDYYYAKLNSFNKNINSTLTKQILISPQNEADMNAPDLSLSSIKIPVYQKHIVDLTDEVYEDSGIGNIKEVIVDFDLDIDSNNDGNTKNDDDLNLDGDYTNQINILRNPAYLKLDFKAFDKLIKKKIGITLIDSNGNTGYSEVLLEVYSPVPNISTYKDGLVEGSLMQENLSKEPINLYRFRGGTITKLEDKSGTGIILTDNGKYSFDVAKDGTGLKLFDEDKKEIAFVNEKTGKISIKDYLVKAEVLSSSDIKNDSVFPKILLNRVGIDIFYEYLEMKGVNKVSFVNNFEEVIEKGIYFKFSDYTNYSYYTIPEGLDYNPGALSIYRNNSISKEALFTIFTDGRINTINDNDFKIKYDFYQDYIVLKLYDKNDFSNREIGRVLFMTDSEYIMK